MEPTAPGFFIFTDQPGNTQRVRVKRVDGELVAFFEGMEPGDAPVPVADMDGAWEPGMQTQVEG